MKNQKPLPWFLQFNTIVLGLICVLLGIFVLATLAQSNGLQSRWRMAIAATFARSVLDVIEQEGMHWSAS